MTQDKIRQILQKNIAFSTLQDSELEEFIPYFSEQNYKLGELIIRQGQPSGGYYIIVSGKARVLDVKDREANEDEKHEKAANAQKDLTLALLKKGDGFGEYSLLTGKPAGATVRASGDLRLIKLSESAFHALIKKKPSEESRFREIIKSHEQFNSLKRLTIFSELRPDEIFLLLNVLETVELNKGELLFREGEPGDAVYVVRSGKVKIFSEENNKTLSIEKKGSLIGEIALIKNQPRMASALTMESTRLYKFCQKAFQEVLPQIRDKVEAVIANRMLQYQAFTSDESQDSGRPESQFITETHHIPNGLQKKNIAGIRVNTSALSSLACSAMILNALNKALPAKWQQWTAACLQNAKENNLSAISWYLEESGLCTRKVRIRANELNNRILPAVAMQKDIPVVIHNCRKGKITVFHPVKGLEVFSMENFKSFWNGELLLTEDIAEFGKKKSGSLLEIYSFFLPFIYPHKNIIFQIILVSLILMLLGLAAPFFTKNIIDKALVYSDRSLINIMLTGMICVTIFQLIGTGIRNLCTVSFVRQLEAAINAGLFHHITNLAPYHFNKFKPGEYLTRFEENRKLLELISGTAMTLSIDVIMVFFYMLLLLAQHVQLTFIGLIFIAAQFILILLYSPKLRANDQKLFDAETSNMSYIMEMIRGIHVVKSLAGESLFFQQGMNKLSEKISMEFIGAELHFSVKLLSQAIFSIAVLCILTFGSYSVLNGQLSLGEFVAFNAVYGLIINPVNRLVGMWAQIQKIRIAFERVNDILELRSENHWEMQELTELKGNISFENIYFRYDGMTNDALRNINLEIRAGQKIALVGRSGCGKSTLAKLLLGFLKPASGKIFIDDMDISTVHPSSIAQHMGVIDQKPFLFDGTIKDNIIRANPDIPYTKLIAAAALAGVKEFTDTLSFGLDTRVGEGGAGLSGGQIQKIAIARAIVCQPAILIMDEATSSLDVESENIIHKNLDRLMKEKTNIIITHRLNSITNADMIVMMDKGSIVETGTHESLMAAQGLYYYLYNLQK